MKGDCRGINNLLRRKFSKSSFIYHKKREICTMINFAMLYANIN